MIEENREYHEYHHDHRNHWLKTLGCILATLLGAFLAFYFVVDSTLNRMMDPTYQMKKMEKMMYKDQKHFDKMERKMSQRHLDFNYGSSLVNLIKESDEYKIIVNLKPFDGNEKNINVKLVDNVITVSGEMEKMEHHRENIMSFAQSYYLDEKINPEKMLKERKGNEYIITIPFEE